MADRTNDQDESVR